MILMLVETTPAGEAVEVSRETLTFAALSPSPAACRSMRSSSVSRRATWSPSARGDGSAAAGVGGAGSRRPPATAGARPRSLALGRRLRRAAREPVDGPVADARPACEGRRRPAGECCRFATGSRRSWVAPRSRGPASGAGGDGATSERPGSSRWRGEPERRPRARPGRRAGAPTEPTEVYRPRGHARVAGGRPGRAHRGSRSPTESADCLGCWSLRRRHLWSVARVVGAGRRPAAPDGFTDLLALTGVAATWIVSRVVIARASRLAAATTSRSADRHPDLADLYIPCGISGAIQHWAGCLGQAHPRRSTPTPRPHGHRATYAVIGDLHEVVPGHQRGDQAPPTLEHDPPVGVLGAGEGR